MKSCNDCPLREQCQAPCEAVERLLPDVDHARIHGFQRRNALQFARRMRDEIEAARLMTDWRHVLNGRMREVFDMTYNEGLKQSDIAQRLGISRRVAGRYLERARAKIQRHINKA
jgi:RNA polymerase sigma factor (sigma-70 family)